MFYSTPHKIVETTRGGSQVAPPSINSGSQAGAGALFGLAIAPRAVVYYVACTLRLLH